MPIDLVHDQLVRPLWTGCQNSPWLLLSDEFGHRLFGPLYASLSAFAPAVTLVQISESGHGMVLPERHRRRNDIGHFHD